MTNPVSTLIGKFRDFFNLQESLDYVPPEIQKRIRNRGAERDIEYTFSIDDYDYSVLIALNESNVADFMFAILGDEFTDPLSIVNVGSPHKVFGAVANIFKMFTEEHKGEYKSIKFTAYKKDTSRVKLYDRFIRAPIITNGFNVSIDDRDMIKIYHLTPKSP